MKLLTSVSVFNSFAFSFKNSGSTLGKISTNLFHVECELMGAFKSYPSITKIEMKSYQVKIYI